MKSTYSSPSDHSVNWSVAFSVLTLNLRFKVSDEPILCYVYLDGCVIDVRGTGKELTKI